MRRPITTIIKIALAAALLVVAPAAAVADSGQQTIHYHGVTLHVSRQYRVYNLAKYPHTCVRFNRPAVYLGTPGAQQNCPANEIGRPEAILVEPRGARHATVVRTADPQLNTPTAATLFSARTADDSAQKTHPDGATADYIGKGFDACRTPTTATLAGFTANTYRAVGTYIGGVNLGCAQPNVTPSLVTWAENNGWHLIPTYVGLQAPGSSCGSCEQIPENDAKHDGQGAAEEAVSEMQALGLGRGNPIYYDMEAYRAGGARTTAALAFLQGWTKQLHAAGYLSGVYGSGDSTIADLVSKYGKSFMGATYVEPDELWVATWNNHPTDFEYVPSGEWTGELLNQYGGDESLHGMDVDYDYIDGATAPYSELAPTTSPRVSVSTTADGLIDAVTGWTPITPPADPIVNWVLLGGDQSDETDAPLAETSFGLEKPVLSTESALRYYRVEALGDDDNNILGLSPITQAPAHVAIYGKRAFVPTHGSARLPVGCFWQTACNLRLTLRVAGQTIATSSFQQVASYQDGSLIFSLNTLGQRLLARHRGGLNASATVTDRAGKSVKAPIELTAYNTSGAAPKRYSAPSKTLRLFGRTAFVVGRTGGVLAACSGLAPCKVETTISWFGSTLAQSGIETIGANQLGYLYFTLTKAARKLLDSTSGNQLDVSVSMVNQVPLLSQGFGYAGDAQANVALTQAY
jgi:hypothetical protein